MRWVARLLLSVVLARLHQLLGKGANHTTHLPLQWSILLRNSPPDISPRVTADTMQNFTGYFTARPETTVVEATRSSVPRAGILVSVEPPGHSTRFSCGSVSTQDLERGSIAGQLAYNVVLTSSPCASSDLINLGCLGRVRWWHKLLTRMFYASNVAQLE